MYYIIPILLVVVYLVSKYYKIKIQENLQKPIHSIQQYDDL